MNRNIERRKANGELYYLELGEFYPNHLIIKNGQIVNQEAWNIIQERKKQANYIPTEEDKQRALNTQKQLENIELEKEKQKNKELEERLSKLEKLINGKEN